MPIELTMPRLSDTMEAGTVIRWNVKEGDAVKSGAVVADIETDKATMEMPCFDDGRIAAILVESGKQVKVGTPIAIVALEGEDLAAVTAGITPARRAGERNVASRAAGPSRRRRGSTDGRCCGRAGRFPWAGSTRRCLIRASERNPWRSRG